MKRSSPPTRDEVSRVIEAREVGARLPDGPFEPRELEDGRWSIRAIAYGSGHPYPDITLERDGKDWKVAKQRRTERHEEDDPIVARVQSVSLPIQEKQKEKTA